MTPQKNRRLLGGNRRAQTTTTDPISPADSAVATAPRPRIFGDVKPKSVRAIFHLPLTPHDQQRIDNLIAEGIAENYGVAKISNGIRTVVVLHRNPPPKDAA